MSEAIYLADPEGNGIEIYRDRLGFDLTARYGRQASFFPAGGYHHHVGVNTWTTAGAPPAPEGPIGLGWFRIATGGERPPAWIQSSLESGGATVREEDGGFWTRDPSGNAVVIAA